MTFTTPSFTPPPPNPTLPPPYQEIYYGALIKFSNRQLMKSTAIEQLPFPYLPKFSLSCHKFNNFVLLLCFVGKFCDNSMCFLFNINNAWVCDNNTSNMLLMCYCDTSTQIYMIQYYVGLEPLELLQGR